MRRLGTSVALLVIVCAVGCGSSAEKAVDVAGVVSVDGQPLEGVEVHFATDKFEGYGKTDEDGKYRLVNGAVAGTNKIYLKKFNTTAAGPGIDMSIPGMDEGQAAALMAAQGKTRGAKVAGSVIPAEYSDLKTTKLTFTVPAGGTEAADFRISSTK